MNHELSATALPTANRQLQNCLHHPLSASQLNKKYLLLKNLKTVFLQTLILE